MNLISLFIYSMLLNVVILLVVFIHNFVKIKVIKQNNKIFIIRLTIYLPKGSVKFHLILKDDENEPHTHPWKYTSFLLLGAYKETIFIEDSTDWFISPLWSKLEFTNHHKMWDTIRCKADDKHLITLYTLWGIKIPCLTVGYYGPKEQLCSLCAQLGYCKTTGKSYH